MDITGDRIKLRPIKPDEKEAFYLLATQSDGSRFWYDTVQKEQRSREAFFKDWVEDYFIENGVEKGQVFWIEADKHRIGAVAVNKFDEKNRRVELDIIIGSEKYFGKGYGTETLKLIIAYLFDNFALNKIWITARANNPRAIRAYEKAGFVREGLLRQHDFINNEFVNVIQFGLLKDEFKSEEEW